MIFIVKKGTFWDQYEFVMALNFVSQLIKNNVTLV